MEDLFENIGILLIVIVGIIAKIGESSLNKRKKQGSAPMESDNTAPHEDGYPFDDGGHKSMQPATIRPESRLNPSQTFTTTTTGLNTAATTIAHPIAEKKTVRHEVVAESASVEHQLRHRKGANTANDSAQIDFDLRKAVIYSEILSPKFKDYD